MGTYKSFAGSNSEPNNGSNEPENGVAKSAPFLTLGSGGSNGGSSGDDSGGIERDSNGEQFDPELHVSPDRRNSDGSFRKKRGAASATSSGNKRRRKEKSNSANIESLTSILAIVHVGLATATKTPELALENEEAEALAKASEVVLVEFDIQPNPKVQAIVGLVMTAGSIYGPRAYLIRERWKEERESE